MSRRERLTLDDCHAVDSVAYAIGKVIAEKTIAADPNLARLDALGRASAAHTMATNMIGELQDEALAAWLECGRIQSQSEDVREVERRRG